MDSGGAADAFLTVTLLDLISYEFLKHRLGSRHDDVFAVHEQLGRLDAAISIASYRASLDHRADPVLHCERGGKRFLHGEGLRHPLLRDPVPNDCAADRPMLITGSNASGKSTYLKTVALAALLAQSIGTVPADSYEAGVFRIFSSMALRDDLMAGESSYVAEIRSLKRILDAAGEGDAVLCVVDEVLRGTNTVERIAASAELLRAMADAGVLCFAATHDGELCELLQDCCDLYHFEEQLGEEGMAFDYRLRAGRNTSRNAIRLLSRLGFDPALVDRADKRASRYLETGAWR